MKLLKPMPIAALVVFVVALIIVVLGYFTQTTWPYRWTFAVQAVLYVALIVVWFVSRPTPQQHSD